MKGFGARLKPISQNDLMQISAIAALSFMFFNLFTPPCFAAIGAMEGLYKIAGNELTSLSEQ